MNDKIRARIQQLDERTIGNMANDLEATRITDEVKGVCTKRTWVSSREMNAKMWIPFTDTGRRYTKIVGNEK